MKLRTIGAVLAGAAMIGATVAGAAAAADAPAKSWFIDPTTGQPNVTVVVGAQANASDVVSASLIAAAVGNMATVEETASTTKSASATFDKVMEYNYTYNDAPRTAVPATSGLTYETYQVSANGTWAGAPCTYRTAKWYTDYALGSLQFWETAQNTWPNANYDIAVALMTPTEIRSGPNVVSQALNTLWFSNSPKDWDSKDRVYAWSVSQVSGGAARTYFLQNQLTAFASPTADTIRVVGRYAGGSYDDGDGGWDFDNAGYAFFDTEAWVDVESPTTFSETADCDYIFGGTGTLMEAHEEIQVIFGDKYESDPGPNGIADLIGNKGHVSGIVYRTAEIRYPLLENGQNICGISHCNGMIDFQTARKGYLNEIKFLGKMYKPMFAGATYRSGSPDAWYLGAYFMYGTPYAEAEKIMKVGDVYTFHGWTVTLNDVNIYENKAYLTVAGPALTAPFSFIMVMDAIGVAACSPCCPDCAVYGGGGAFTSNPTQRTEYDPYVVKTTVSKEKSGYSYDFFQYVNFMLDGIKTFVGADGTYLGEFNFYAIENYGYFEDKGCCDPFVTTPNDYGLAIYGGWRKVDFNDARIALPLYYMSWEETANDDRTTYILWEPAPRCDTYCPDANFDTIELQLCDTINIPNCETSYTVNGPENYFTIDISDVDYGTGNNQLYAFAFNRQAGYYGVNTGSGVGAAPRDAGVYNGQTAGAAGTTDTDGLKFKVTMATQGDVIKYTANVKIDPVELIKLDIEVNTATNTKNLVLVGGPVYNSIVKDLVDMGASTVDWATSAGEWEWIADPMAKGYDVLIVAGANREETRMAAEDLVAMMN